MEKLHLFRKRFLPEEIIELKDDIIIYHDNDVLVTKWNVLKPRKDIAHGVSAYFLNKGIKVSKVYDHDDQLVYWYCDIIQTDIDEKTLSYYFTDLLIDVLVYPDGHHEVVDLDEFAYIVTQGILSPEVLANTLRVTNDLLQIIYSGKFSELTKYITNNE